MLETQPKLVAHDAAQTVAAGGIVALGAKLPEDQRTSPVTARAYPHPALDGKIIVRIEPEAVAAGTDAEMAAFGFGEPTVSDELGQVRHRTLGFPAWALVHDPKKAKAALDVTEDVRKAKRMVQAKPGHAKDAFEKIAKTLQRTAPQFLPSFWEEAGRVFGDQGNATYGAQCFERARQAERAYKLKTDPEDADAVFIEFALLGALSAKTLSQYAKDLAKAEGGKEAYRRFRAIIVKRALGGMPPYSGMGKDLTSLVEAAELDQETEEDKLVAELIEAPGVNKAPTEFWKTYRDTLIRLGKATPEMRNRLRNVWPDPRGGNDDSKKAFKTEWLELLNEVGALTDLPDDGLGAFVTRMIRYVGKTDRSVEVLRREAPRLAALKQAIGVAVPARWGTDLDLDLAELVLELGLELADPPRWDDFDRDTISCDPVRVAAHPKYGKKLREVTANMMGRPEYEHKMKDKAGFTAARRAWIEEHLDQLTGKTLLDISDTLGTIEGKTSADTFVAFPDLYERLAKTDIAKALVLQLAGGVVDELGWPVYEEAFAKLGDGKFIKLGGAFPVLCMWNKTKVVAIDGTGVIAEHDFVYKVKDEKIDTVFFFGDQFLVEIDGPGWPNKAYWSARPKDKFELKNGMFSTYSGRFPRVIALPDGSFTFGGKPFRPGDTTFDTDMRHWSFDGTTHYYSEGEDKMSSFDTSTGKKIEPAQPQFLKDFALEGWKLELDECRMYPLPPGAEASPLGHKDGWYGKRLRVKELPKRNRASDDDDDDYEANAPVEVERIDGKRAAQRREAYLSLPGDDELRGISADDVYSGNWRFDDGGSTVQVYHRDLGKLYTANEDPWAAHGWGAVHVPPAVWWHFLVPRDPAGSAALRGVSVEAAQAILAVARTEVAERTEDEDKAKPLPKTEEVVRAHLPQVTDPKLIAGIAGVAGYAGEVANRLDDIVANRSKDNVVAGGGLMGEPAELRKIAAALAAGKPAKLREIDVDPREWLVNARARAALSLSPLEDEDDRRKARDFVRALGGTIFADDLSKFRILDLEAPDDFDSNEYSVVKIEIVDGSVFAIEENSNWAIEMSTDGVWRMPREGWKLEKETRLTKGIGTAWADAFGELPEGPWAWDPAIAATVAQRADLSIPEAALLAVGIPRGWGRDFLGKAKRDILGLKMGEADAARTTFEELDEDQKLALFDKAVPDDPALLKTPAAPGGWAERLGDAWKAKFGKRAKIPQDLIAAAKKETDLDDLGKLLSAFAGAHDDVDFLKVDTRSFAQLFDYSDAKGLDDDKTSELLTMIAWLFVSRPVGDPIRAGIPAVVEKMRAALGDERVLWRIDTLYIDDEDKKDDARARGIVDMVGGKPIKLPKDDDEECLDARDDGNVVVAYYKNHVKAAFYTANVAKGRKKIDTIAKALVDEDDDPDASKTMLAVEHVLSDEFAAFGERVTDTLVPEGGYEANPLASVPKLVAKVAKELSVSEDAAALYLQTLALPEPTQARVQLWNGWKPKQYQTAAAELVKKKIVTEGKRERFGRSIFIKGGYTKGDGKNLPIEEWKQPFFKVIRRQLPTEPCHLLFARAWKRVEDGDKP